MKVAIWAVNLEKPIISLGNWLQLVENQLKYAPGVDLLVLPEYACMHWLYFKPTHLPPHDELRWMSSLVKEAIDGLKEISSKYKVGIMAGSMPVKEGVLIKNRAYLIDHRSGVIMKQDKLHPIPTERDKNGWFVSPGTNGIKYINWNGLKTCIVICHDSQSKTVVKELEEENPDLVIVPSMTEHENGAMGHRAIFASAKHIATVLNCTVCAAGAIGTQRLIGRSEPNVGGAAIYVGRRTIHEYGPYSKSPDAWGPMIIDNLFHMKHESAA